MKKLLNFNMSVDKKVELMRTLFAIVVSLVILLLLIILVSETPILAIKEMFIGPFTNEFYVKGIIQEWIPLTLTGLALAIILSSGIFNLAAEGAFYAGGIVAMMLATTMNLPFFIFLAALFLIAGFIGSFIVAVPGYLENKIKAPAIVSSIMLNFVILGIGSWMFVEFFRDQSRNNVVSKPFNADYLMSLQFGFAVVVLALVLIYLMMEHTSFGVKIKSSGKNAKYAQTMGVKVGFTRLFTQILGGFLAAIGGAIYQLMLFKRYSTSGLPGYGWDGIIVAVIARNKIIFVPLAALFIAYLRTGSLVMSVRTDVPAEIIDIVQGIVILLIISTKLLRGYKTKLNLKKIDDVPREVIKVESKVIRGKYFREVETAKRAGGKDV